MATEHLDQATRDLYAQAAANPDDTLCCVSSAPWQMPGLVVPQIMHDMNYGCGTTVRPSDVGKGNRVLYIGAGAGLELLQFAYLTRQPAGVVALDVVEDMLTTADRNLIAAEADNDWFQRDFVELRMGDARELPIETDSFDVVAQNCLFNIFEADDLDRALRESARVLKPGGRLVLSDPICEVELPEAVRQDPQLRAACLSGAIPLNDYVDRLVQAGFGTVEIRSRRPYRVLTPRDHAVDENVMLETVEVAAFKGPIPADGPCIFTGRTAIYIGEEEFFDDRNGHLLRRNIPASVCDKTAGQLAGSGREDILLTDSTWHYPGDGCC